MPELMREMSKYKWVSNFHHILWEKIKAANPDMPRWTFRQLTANKWGLRLTGRRGYIELFHKDGTVKQFLLTINGLSMPHVEGLFCHLYGINHLQLKRSELPVVKEYISSRMPRLTLDTSRANTIKVTYPTALYDNPEYLFPGVNDVPLDESYTADPRITTSKHYVYGIINPRFFKFFEITSRVKD